MGATTRKIGNSQDIASDQLLPFAEELVVAHFTRVLQKYDARSTELHISSTVTRNTLNTYIF